MSGTQDVVGAGGVQNMSTIPIGASMIVGKELGIPDPFSGSVGWTERYGDRPINQFYGAEMIAKDWDLSREELARWVEAAPARCRAPASTVVPIRASAAAGTRIAVGATAPRATRAAVHTPSASSVRLTPAPTTAMSISVRGMNRR